MPKTFLHQEDAEMAERQLAAIVTSSDDAIIGKTIKGIITSWNIGAEKIFGYSPKEAIGKPITFIIPKELHKEEDMILAKVGRGEHIDHYETVRVAKDGRRVSVSLTISPIRDENGKIIGASKIARDITDEKRLRENFKFLSEASKILSSSLDFKTTLHNVTKLAVPHIADWCSVEMLNEKGEIDLVGVAHKDPKKISWAQELRKKYPPDMSASQGLPNVLRTGKSELYPLITDAMLEKTIADKKQLRLAKKLHFSSVMIVPIIVNKKPIGGISFVAAESNKHYSEEELKIAEELALRAALAIENATLYTQSQRAISIRDDFISIASHELKTPVTSLKVYTQVLQRQFEKKGEIAISTYLKKMDNQIEKLTKLIRDLLDVSRVEVGKLIFRKEQFDIALLVDDVVRQIAPTTKKHTIVVKAKKKIVYADRDRIGQILINLLTNAIKFSTDSKDIHVTVKDGNKHVQIAVQDFGRGIDDHEQSKIFDRFYQVTDPEEKTFPGLGIGLYISNEIAKRHGGKITVKSKKGRGSTFYVNLPIGEK